MLSTHSSAARKSIYIGQIETEVATLDSIFNRYRTKNERTFVKIDTQGFETEVLKGAKESLPSITGVQLELSIVPLYEGQDLYRYFWIFLKNVVFYFGAFCQVSLILKPVNCYSSTLFSSVLINPTPMRA